MMVGYERKASALEPNLGAQLVHNTLPMGSFCANERTLNDSKEMKRGVCEQGREN